MNPTDIPAAIRENSAADDEQLAPEMTGMGVLRAAFWPERSVYRWCLCAWLATGTRCWAAVFAQLLS